MMLLPNSLSLESLRDSRIAEYTDKRRMLAARIRRCGTCRDTGRHSRRCR